jgi:hypothetical protein
MNVQAGRDNDAEFGRPSNEKGEGAFPQVRTVALAETGSRALQGVEVGPLSEGEQTMARKLWPLLKPGDLVVGDRGFLSHQSCRSAWSGPRLSAPEGGSSGGIGPHPADPARRGHRPKAGITPSETVPSAGSAHGCHPK